jgi:hypothetical protein
MEQWMSFTPDIAEQLHQALINQPFETQIRLKTSRNRFYISIANSFSIISLTLVKEKRIN